MEKYDQQSKALYILLLEKELFYRKINILLMGKGLLFERRRGGENFNLVENIHPCIGLIFLFILCMKKKNVLTPRHGGLAVLHVSGSSLPSLQSASPSQYHVLGIHRCSTGHLCHYILLSIRDLKGKDNGR